MLAALLSALKVTGAPLSEQRIMFLGAGGSREGREERGVYQQVFVRCSTGNS